MREYDQSQLLQFHAFLLGDTADRLARFEQALAQRISHGDIVLDLGCGTGVLAFLAARAGARKIYAIEETDAIELARSLSAANRLNDCIVLLQQSSFGVELPERADVLVADIFDAFGVQPGGLGSVLDARRRLLRPSASLIPFALELHLAPVEAHQLYAQRVTFWSNRVAGIDLSPLMSCAVNNRYSARFDEAALLSRPASIPRIELSDLETPLLSAELNATIARSGTMHGLCGWFTADLATGISVSNAPGAGDTRYKQAFFPTERPIDVSEGNSLSITIHSYDNLGFRWHVEVRDGRQIVATFDHSTSLGFPLSEERIRTMLPNYKPQLTRHGEAQRFLLDMCDGRCSLEMLSSALRTRFADLFKSADAAMSFVRATLAPAT